MELKDSVGQIIVVVTLYYGIPLPLCAAVRYIAQTAAFKERLITDIAYTVWKDKGSQGFAAFKRRGTYAGDTRGDAYTVQVCAVIECKFGHAGYAVGNDQVSN